MNAPEFTAGQKVEWNIKASGHHNPTGVEWIETEIKKVYANAKIGTRYRITHSSTNFIYPHMLRSI